MTILIKKVADKEFVAIVTDPAVTYISEYEIEFAPFRNGIESRGTTWSEALENIKKQIDRYLNVYKSIFGRFPNFTKDGTATIITENVTIMDFIQ